MAARLAETGESQGNMTTEIFNPPGSELLPIKT